MAGASEQRGRQRESETQAPAAEPHEQRVELPHDLPRHPSSRPRPDEAGVRAAVESLLAAGTESLTIAFLNAYVNPAHERRAREIALEVRPGLPVSLSSDLVSEYREYERTLTAVLNSYTQPQVIK